MTKTKTTKAHNNNTHNSVIELYTPGVLIFGRATDLNVWLGVQGICFFGRASDPNRLAAFFESKVMSMMLLSTGVLHLSMSR